MTTEVTFMQAFMNIIMCNCFHRNDLLETLLTSLGAQTRPDTDSILSIQQKCLTENVNNELCEWFGHHILTGFF